MLCVGGGRGRGHLLVSCVPMREQKNDEKGYFFQAGQCYFVGKGYVFLQISEKVAEVREYAF